MSLEDRDWYKEDFDRRTGRSSKRGQTLDERDDWKERKHSEPQPKAKNERPAERVKRREQAKPTEEEKRAYQQVPPAHTFLAARYELAIRRRTQKTFWAGVVGGMIAGAALAETIRALM
ncbi:hypothetical protein L1F06_007680 [Ectopseudomonas hydrolytica]|uniref:Uncharacterized protein n=1 Tax=Ectopseudomonas hydrolytica TaxID=2493633 RepID=A0ABY5ABR4_9GAMM|nr:hypothetical protein [Pseudomonas hydrolytica]USR41303.1 hypothetical protein L1F06_007680 [Pseudomonas hydrolytica]